MRLLAQKAQDSTHNTDLQQKLMTNRAALYLKVVDLTKSLWRAFPAIADHVDKVHGSEEPINANAPKKYDLPLPSRFNEHIRNACQTLEAGLVEHRLREGQAYDALEDVRLNVLSICFSSRLQNKNEIHGQYASTRAATFVHKLHQEAREAGQRYNHPQQALLRLGLSEDSRIFQWLDLEKDLKIKDPAHRRQLGDSRIQDPWYWRTAMPDNMKPQERDAWIEESMFVIFFIH